MRAGHHPRGAVLAREIGERPHDADLQLQAGELERIEGVVAVQGLARLARQDLDRRQAADLVGRAVRQQDLVGDGHHHVVIDEAGGARRAGEHAVRAQGLRAVEVAAKLQARAVELRPQFAQDAVDQRLLGEPGDDDRAVAA